MVAFGSTLGDTTLRTCQLGYHTQRSSWALLGWDTRESPVKTQEEQQLAPTAEISLEYPLRTSEVLGKMWDVGRWDVEEEEMVGHQSNHLGSHSLYKLGPAIKASGWRRVQPGHSHMNGFTVLWICLCCLRPEDVAKVLPQSGQAWARAPTCCERM